MADASPEIEALRTALAAAEARAATAEARASEARAMVAGNEAVIATLKLEIEKLKRVLYGQKSERRARLLDQLELRLEELEAAATEDELAAEKAAAQARTAVRAFERRRPARKPFPAHLPRERVVIGDARGGPPPVEGHPDGPREVHATACAVPPDSARLGRPEPAGDDPVREVRPAPAAEPPGRARPIAARADEAQRRGAPLHRCRLGLPIRRRGLGGAGRSPRRRRRGSPRRSGRARAR
jgi:hypothetical protein